MTATLAAAVLAGAPYTPHSTAATPKPKHNPRYQVAAQLNQQLGGTPMAGTGFQLEAAGWRYRIHPAFIAAIAGVEGSYGRAACRGNPHNTFGLASCGSSWHVPYFPKWADAYDFMGRFLSTRWPRARTPYDFRGYAACSSCWGRAVAWHMARFGLGTDVRYP